jgi:hypothetical protein
VKNFGAGIKNYGVKRDKNISKIVCKIFFKLTARHVIMEAIRNVEVIANKLNVHRIYA